MIVWWIRYSEILDYSFMFPLGQHSLKILQIKRIKEWKYQETEPYQRYAYVYQRFKGIYQRYKNLKSNFMKSNI